MQRVGFVLKVKQDRIEEYKEHHRNVWPEMLEALRKNGWRNYSLYMREDGTLENAITMVEAFLAE